MHTERLATSDVISSLNIYLKRLYKSAIVLSLPFRSFRDVRVCICIRSVTNVIMTAGIFDACHKLRHYYCIRSMIFIL